jgi:hypothetical protein
MCLCLVSIRFLSRRLPTFVEQGSFTA